MPGVNTRQRFREGRFGSCGLGAVGEVRVVDHIVAVEDA